jgi:NADH-quinone oxidoreductase subunit I
MAIDTERDALKRTTYGQGLLKGLQITLRHLFSRSVTVQYPDERPNLPPRSRGVIALKEENCTVCMLCARECPDWCIYIEGHKEERQPAQPGKRAKKYNVLDRFAIDYALCMYCGICVDVCPYDALFWTPEFEYAEHDITELTHEMKQLTDWMYTVLPPPPLDDGAKGPEFKVAARGVAAGSPAGSGSTVTPSPAATLAPSPESKQSVRDTAPNGTSAGTARASEGEDEIATESGAPRDSDEEAISPSTEREPAEVPNQVVPSGGASPEEAAEIRRKVYEEEIGKGSDPRVAEGRAKAAEIRALKGTKGPG